MFCVRTSIHRAYSLWGSHEASTGKGKQLNCLFATYEFQSSQQEQEEKTTGEKTLPIDEFSGIETRSNAFCCRLGSHT